MGCQSYFFRLIFSIIFSSRYPPPHTHTHTWADPLLKKVDFKTSNLQQNSNRSTKIYNLKVLLKYGSRLACFATSVCSTPKFPLKLGLFSVLLQLVVGQTQRCPLDLAWFPTWGPTLAAARPPSFSFPLFPLFFPLFSSKSGS